jgi:hypothetical protein
MAADPQTLSTTRLHPFRAARSGSLRRIRSEHLTLANLSFLRVRSRVSSTECAAGDCFQAHRRKVDPSVLCDDFGPSIRPSWKALEQPAS